MTLPDHVASTGALIRASHPWADETLARLYDSFPFGADLPFYLDLARNEGGTILEPCCGSGRVLVPLARAGHAVVGLDASAHMLALARQKAIAAGASVAERIRLIEGDVRAFGLDERFDLAIIAVNSFCYLVERNDQQLALAAVARHLRPGGLLALDLLNPSPSWLALPAGTLNQDLVRDDPDNGVTVARTEAVVRTDLAAQVRVIRSAYEVIEADGSVRKRLVEWPLRFTYRFEAEHLLERAGFAIEAIYGGFEREPFASDSPRMVFCARRTSDR